ncbi:unnamed protein product [Arctia plantaginis]|uniref:SAC3/GANP/THP3 conserved domain-containing protein n=1 Tax=Arctia plantaginis TaxID=874455 RepID=A0A8S1B112_ARCPL|nr:unnamed protein product [Arctia plantaginis]
MSSYFDYYCKRKSDTIAGTCYSMCPEEEIKLRETSKLIHVLEVVGSKRQLVKSYCRSAADLHIAVPKLLRPYSVLTHTVEYLLVKVTQRDDVPQPVVYDFVNDRLRAVRQDMTIQRLPYDECVNLLEPMVRFYVYYGYLLNDLLLKDFDPHLNKKYLLECTKWFLSCCDSITERPDSELIDRLSRFLHVSNNNDRRLVCDKVLIECLYILCNLDNIHPLYRYIKLSKEMKSNSKLQLAYKIAISNMEGNYIKVFRLLDQLCPLTYCAVFAYLPTLQRRCLQVLSHGYHNKRLTVPSDVIARWLRFPDRQEAKTTCQYYGLTVDGDAVRFDKTQFKMNDRLHQVKTEDLITKFNINNPSDIYTYT